MTIEELNELTREIASSGSDPGKVTALLTQIVDSYGELLKAHSDTKSANEQLTEENTKLKQYNLELFMERGDRVRDTVTGATTETKLSKEEERAMTITPEILLSEGE